MSKKILVRTVEVFYLIIIIWLIVINVNNINGFIF